MSERIVDAVLEEFDELAYGSVVGKLPLIDALIALYEATASPDGYSPPEFHAEREAVTAILRERGIHE